MVTMVTPAATATTTRGRTGGRPWWGRRDPGCRPADPPTGVGVAPGGPRPRTATTLPPGTASVEPETGFPALNASALGKPPTPAPNTSRTNTDDPTAQGHAPSSGAAAFRVTRQHFGGSYGNGSCPSLFCYHLPWPVTRTSGVFGFTSVTLSVLSALDKSVLSSGIGRVLQREFLSSLGDIFRQGFLRFVTVYLSMDS